VIGVVGKGVGTVVATVLMIATPCWFSTYVGTAVTAGVGAGNVCTWVHPAINRVEMTTSKRNISVVFFIVCLLKKDRVKILKDNILIFPLITPDKCKLLSVCRITILQDKKYSCFSLFSLFFYHPPCSPNVVSFRITLPHQ
jgi:hypothetical protein